MVAFHSMASVGRVIVAHSKKLVHQQACFVSVFASLYPSLGPGIGGEAFLPIFDL
jgi:hypothetical protein